MSGPMSPESLARLRRAVGPGGCAYSTLEVSELLEAHDYHAARADNLRARVLDLVAKWRAMGGDRAVDRRAGVYRGCAAQLDRAEAESR